MPTSPPPSAAGFPVLAVAVLGIAVTAFIMITYYIFVTKCCFRWQQIDPLRRLTGGAAPPAFQSNEDSGVVSYSPQSWQTRGLDELLIREIPTVQYTKLHPAGAGAGKSARRCVVCLNEFDDNDVLRILPKCSHAFHLDCIDVWLATNSNCPLCRSTISGRNRYRDGAGADAIVAPNSSPQEPPPPPSLLPAGRSDFITLQISGEDGSSRFLVPAPARSCSSRKFGKSKPQKFHHSSIMGDEGIDAGEQFDIQPIRRSFSMDSAADRHVYFSGQEISRQNRLSIEESSSSSSRMKRSIFSFGNGRGSRNAVLPI
ncbi:RING-H2 finger protein ATL1-like [Andrographis paniculata]|uniref:RING-H2 finger protein ATL1-like n=1 Tax=Andrographis paniculata TaxID=175694 RepID=UPI0021E76580|nr:RING-H2 finger protein ATL1-like [Andrographis paniculata]